ncbi:MAG: putative integral rane protein [Planctomycetota bacterium]|nr:putative integral rane protein [Planctomycetota bacterium]
MASVRTASRVARPQTKKLIKQVVKAGVGILVLVAVARHVWLTWLDLRTKGELPRISVSWAVAAIGLYLVGLSLFGLYFVRVMRASDSPIGVFAGWRAYLISHLGKYVPGKALVVVMRVGLVMPSGARASTAAFATVYETLVMMAAGGFVAFAGLGFGARLTLPLGRWAPPAPVPLGLIGLVMGLAFLFVVHPGIFPRLSALIRQPFPDVGADALPRFTYRLLAEGLGLAIAGWVFLGLSQVAVIRSLSPAGLSSSLWWWPMAVASVALATVSGFVVPVSPGGLGVREWVLWTSLGAVIDKDLAVLASLGLRLVWVAGELLAGAALILVPAPAPIPDGAAT